MPEAIQVSIAKAAMAYNLKNMRPFDIRKKLAQVFHELDVGCALYLDDHIPIASKISNFVASGKAACN